MTDPPQSAHRQDATTHICLVQLNAPALRALADGDLAAANCVSAVPLTPFFVDPVGRTIWRYRRTQLETDPSSAAWITRVIWDVKRQVAVGWAGYHGPPDPRGMVEVGYTVDPTYRRQGYARAALEALLQRAASEPEVHVVRASIRPDNVASLRLVAQYGFEAVGEQWDDQDGREIIYEVAAN